MNKTGSRKWASFYTLYAVVFGWFAWREWTLVHYSHRSHHPSPFLSHCFHAKATGSAYCECGEHIFAPAHSYVGGEADLIVNAGS